MLMRIMMVEPDWHFVGRAKRYLESRGNLVLTEEPAAAAERTHAWKPDLIILAAEYASEELMDELGAMENRPAILLIEHMSRYDRAWAAWQRGGDELLMKPVLRSWELQQAITTARENAAATPLGVPRQRMASA